MREGILSAGLVTSAEVVRSGEQEVLGLELRDSQTKGWNPENFAREQIQGLVRQVFFSRGPRPIRQVVFSAVETESDVRNVCRRVGEALALETAGNVAVVGGYPQLLHNVDTQHHGEAESKDATGPLQRIATRVRGNLWLVPAEWKNGTAATAASLQSYLRQLHREFEYSIIAGPSAGESSEAAAMAQFADGIILVLSALSTRRVRASNIKETLERAQACLLGTVLSDRVFPIPESIYRRL